MPDRFVAKPPFAGTLRALGVFIVAVLAVACDPAIVPGDRNEITISVDVQGGGTAEGDVLVSPDRRDEVKTVTKKVANILFPYLPVDVKIDPNDPGHDFGVFTVQNVYNPGPSPTVSFVDPDFPAEMRGLGFDSVDMYICAPVVASQLTTDHGGLRNDCLFVEGQPQPLSFRMAMTPRPALAWAWLAMRMASGAVVLVSLLLLRRLVRRSWGRLFVILLGVAVTTLAALSRAGWSDDPTVAGQVDPGVWTTLQTVGVYSVMFGLLGSIALSFVVLSRSGGRIASPPPPIEVQP